MGGSVPFMVSDRPVNNCQSEMVRWNKLWRSEGPGVLKLVDTILHSFCTPVRCLFGRRLRPTMSMTDESRTATCIAEWPELAARALKEHSRGDWTGDALALYGVLLDNESH